MSFEAVAKSSQPAAIEPADRLIYVLMALLFIAVAALGFGPRLFATLQGNRSVDTPILHVHAVLMGSWLLLFLTQTSLAATGLLQRHRWLGRAAIGLAPLMIATMLVLAIRPYAAVILADPPAPLPDPWPYVAAARRVAFTLLAQVRDAALFTVFCLWAILARRTAPETHKRMMVLATFVLLDAAVGRMTWLPGYDGLYDDRGFPVANVYHLALLAPVVTCDLLRFGRVHHAYLVGVGILVPSILALHLLWNSQGWQQLVAAMFGVG
jgi:uncharacterized membrane protein YozB (DUF420 family)